jgi:hypothetical protein
LGERLLSLSSLEPVPLMVHEREEECPLFYSMLFALSAMLSKEVSHESCQKNQETEKR